MRLTDHRHVHHNRFTFFLSTQSTFVIPFRTTVGAFKRRVLLTRHINQVFDEEVKMAANLAHCSANKTDLCKRKMVGALIHGQRIYKTANGMNVYICSRDGQFIARGKFNGRQFGKNLGKTQEDAAVELRTLLYELDNGIFVMPSERKKQTIRKREVNLSLDLRNLVELFLTQVGRKKGQKTKVAYIDRLRPILQFEDQESNRRRWPNAASINEDFVVELQNWLRMNPYQDKMGQSRHRKEKTVRNCLETLRTCLNWAKRPENRLLPGDYQMPVTQEILGKEVPKDVFRPNPLSEADKLKIVLAASDRELSIIALFMLLPTRADELAGLCIDDVDLTRRHLLFGINNAEVNFTKGHTAFRIPYPQELDGLIAYLIAGRSHGPLIRQVSSQEQCGRQSVDLLVSWKMEAAMNPEKLRTPNDKKDLFRNIMSRSGGASSDYIGKLFAKIANKAGIEKIQPGFCRDSATNLMERSGMSHLSLRYLTSHSTNDILNTYTGLDIDGEIAKYYAKVQGFVQIIASRFPPCSLKRSVERKTSDEKMVKRWCKKGAQWISFHQPRLILSWISSFKKLLENKANCTLFG